ncbi:MAG TPA: peptidylprolyl isomerase [Candidatus Nitrosotalea sp.]|nr:peptidylprolyl isomerase [Candidatus Nitrosotalea sp.]
MSSGGRPARSEQARGRAATASSRSALAVVAALVAIVALAGVGLGLALYPRPAGAFSSCRTAAQLAPKVYAAPPPMCIDTRASYAAVIDTTQGPIGISFLTGSAPRTVNNFIVLALHGYFDGLAFFNVQSWSIQSGDPSTNGRGGPGYTIPAEKPLAADTWPAGSLGMARFPDGSISGGQFFMVKAAWPGGNPTVSYDHFANITSGIDVLTQLTASDSIVDVSVTRH